MRSSAKRRRPPTPRRRPVLAARVEPEFHARVLASARAHKRNASEELMWLAEVGLSLNTALEDAQAIREKAYSEANAVLAAARRFASADLDAELERRGHTYVRGVNGGAWFDPGVNANQWILDNSNPALMEEALERAAMRAIERMRAQS